MRTDPNTVLSLSSDVPSKAKKLPKGPRESGEAFENDFNKAKEVLNPKSDSVESSSSEKAKVAEPTSASKELPTESTPLESNKEAVVSNKTLEEGEVPVSGSGKVLQLEGDELPVVASLDGNFEGELISPTALETDVQEIANTSLGMQDNLIKSVDTTESATIPNSSGDALIALTGAIELDEVNKYNADDLSGIDSESDTLELSNFTNQPIAPLSKSAVVEPSGDFEGYEGSEELLYDGSELSWVLSQMDGTKAQATPENNDAASDIVKNGAITSSLLAASVNKNGRSESNPVSLSLDASVAGSVGDINTEATETLLLDDAVLVNEPIELRKKEQDAMIGRMSAQVDGRVVDDSVTGGLNSSLQSNNVARSAIGLGAAVNNPQANLTMNLPPNHPGWASEMSQKVAWIARDGGHTAHIRLDPPELGSLTVKVSVDTDSNTQVSFMAASPQARDLLESQMSRLRDMLAQQGMDLSHANVDVSQQDTSGAQEDTEQGNGSNRNGLASQDDIDEDLISSNVSYVSATGVDYYA